MSTKDMLNSYTEMTDKAMSQMNTLGEMNLKVTETLANRQMDMMNLFMEQGVRMMTLATESKGYTEFYKGQIEMTKDMGERMMTESKANMKLANDLRDDYRGWFDAAMTEAKNSSAAVRDAVAA